MLPDFDVHTFWNENRECFSPFSVSKPRVPLVLIFEDHFLMNLIQMESTHRYYASPAYALEMQTKANDLLDSEIGLRPYGEEVTYYVKGAFEVRMGAKRVIREGNTPWLETVVEDIDDIKAINQKLETWDAKRQAIPEEWLMAKHELKSKTGKQLRFAHMLNGPATMACNLLGTTNTCIFIMEEPEVMKEFFTLAALRYGEFYEVACLEDLGYVPKDGLCINDDDCYLFPPTQYENFCVPFMKHLFDTFAPHPQHLRRQHSDSAMGHLLGLLNGLGINEVNFGPELHPADIRRAMPKAIIHGQTAPYLLRNGTEQEIWAAVARDFEAVGKDGGLVQSVAGVVPESTPMANIRAFMQAVHTLTRYE